MSLITILCPTCARQLKLPADAVGKTVKCPACQSIFTAGPDEVREPDLPRSPDIHGMTARLPSSPPPRPIDDDRPRRRDFDEDRPRRTEDDDRSRPRDRNDEVRESGRRGFDDRDDLDLRLPRRREPDEDDYEREDDYARRRRRKSDGSAVTGPAIFLIVVGSLSMIYNVLAVLDIAMGGLRVHLIGMAANPNATMVFKIIVVSIVVVFVLWAFVILIGGILMLNLRSHPLALTAAIVALIPCHYGWCMSLGAGIWSLTVLTNPKVKRAFR